MKPTTIRQLITALAIAFAGTCAIAATPAPDWPTILTGLGSADFATRDAAQRRLDAIPLTRSDEVKKQLASATDPEIKARLLARIDQFDIQRSIDPPPITMNFNASVWRLAEALNKEMGTSIKLEGFYFRSVDPEPMINIAADEMPFWDVFQMIASQGSWTLGTGKDFSIKSVLIRPAAAPGGLRTCVREKGFAFFPLDITRTVDLQSGEPAKPRLVFNYLIAADPRIKILRRGGPTFSVIVDDKGNDLRARKDNRFGMGWTHDLCTLATEELLIPDHPGKKIASAKGEIIFVVEVASTTVEIPDFPRMKDPILQIGGQRLAFTGLKDEPRDVSFGLQNQLVTPGFGGPDANPPMNMMLKLIDADGKELWKSEAGLNMTAGIGLGDHKRPLKLVVTAPLKTHTVTIPFEFRDIPLP